MRLPFSYYRNRMLSSGYAWAVAAGSFFIGCGWRLESRGVEGFQFADKYGKQQSGSPEMLYWIGGGILGVAALRAVVLRMQEVKEFRAKTGDALLPND